MSLEALLGIVVVPSLGMWMNPITVAYASRFGTTKTLGEQIVDGLQSAGAKPQLLDVGTNPSVVTQPLVLLTPIIWDRPIPAMRQWIKTNSGLVRQCTVACGVVCGSAGIRETGGMIYAHQLAKRVGRPDVFRFALSGEIPTRNRMRYWEWWALQIFAGIMRKPQLFSIRADPGKARDVGSEIGAQIYPKV